MTALVALLGISLAVLFVFWAVAHLQRAPRRALSAACGALLHPAHPAPARPVLVRGKFPAGAEFPEQLWKEVSGLTRKDAEELLDWLEANGYGASELEEDARSGFVVRFK